jgi:heptosyltransferase-2
MREPRSILLRAPNWTGDWVMATPGFRALRARFPGAHVALHVRAGLEPLAAGAPWFDEVIPIRSQRLRGAARWRAILREGRALRRRGGFDLGVCVPESFSSALLMRAAGVRRIAGFRRGGRGFLLHVAVSPPAAWGRRRLVARERFVLELVRAVGAEARGTQLELFTTDEEEAAAERLLAAAGVAAGAPLAALAPGASYGPSKLWPAAGFARVGDALARAGGQVVLLGAPGEEEIAARVAAAMREKAAVLAGRTDLGGLKALLRRARVLVCNDAGGRHVAVAFGVPVVVVMGPTAIEKTAENLERAEVLCADVACRPCYLRRCPIDHRCMRRVAPERVAAAALRALSREVRA